MKGKRLAGRSTTCLMWQAAEVEGLGYLADLIVTGPCLMAERIDACPKGPATMAAGRVCSDHLGETLAVERAVIFVEGHADIADQLPPAWLDDDFLRGQAHQLVVRHALQLG